MPPPPTPVDLPPPPVQAPEPAAPTGAPLFPDGLPVVMGELPAGLANISAQGCNGCHYAVHDEWSSSAHRGAWLEQPFRRAVEATGDSPLCLSCHLPIANQQPQVVVEYQGGPLSTAVVRPNRSWDPTLAQEGVTCAACHVRGGAVLSTRPAPKAPHPVAVSAELDSSAMCATCHQLTWTGADKPFYDTYGEWNASAYKAAGIGCQDCHMPPSAGLVTAGHFAAHASHGFGADRARAVSVLVDLDPDAATRGKDFVATIVVQNTGAGHAFPTGSPFKAVRLEALVLDADGKALGKPFTYTMGRSVTPEPPYTTLSDTRLLPGAQQELPVRLPLPQSGKGGRGAFEVRLTQLDAAGKPGAPFLVQRIPLTVY